mmetsp:Transcript_13697/g.57585  ORF Transcript_13697/g.57585 Transcript_13697/m.57585 type:complete len:237 (-) Transcript_13697:3051-3761(-)
MSVGAGAEAPAPPRGVSRAEESAAVPVADRAAASPPPAPVATTPLPPTANAALATAFSRCLACFASRLSSFTSLSSATFSPSTRATSARCASVSFFSFRLRFSMVFSRNTRWRANSFCTSSSRLLSATSVAVTCFWYSSLTEATSFLGYCTRRDVACRSAWNPRIFWFLSDSVARCLTTSFCKPASLCLRSWMVRSRCALDLWYRSSSWSILWMVCFMSATSCSRGSISFFSSLIL